MTFFENNTQRTPSGFSKILYLNWPIVILICSIAGIGFIMLYSVAGGSFTPWLEPQLKRFFLGMVALLIIAMCPIWFWKNVAALMYLTSVILLISVEFFGVSGMGAQRWLDLGFIRLQPSELTKVTTVVFLAAYYDWLGITKVSRPVWVLIPILIILLPVSLIINQPDLGTALLVLFGGGGLMFLAGVHWGYFAGIVVSFSGFIATILKSRETDWSLLREYQYHRIDTFLNPSNDPMGAGYHIAQSKIALGSGGLNGRGFMQGTQSQLNFLPEKHTDFIFTTLAEEFGFIGGFSVLGMYCLVVIFCMISAMNNTDRFSSLISMGIGLIFFLYFAPNMAMVMGFAPIVGVPLPLISYGGSSMLVLLGAFGLMQSAHIHKMR